MSFEQGDLTKEIDVRAASNPNDPLVLLQTLIDRLSFGPGGIDPKAEQTIRHLIEVVGTSGAFPNTDVAPGHEKLDTEEWPPEGPLKMYGYRTGKNGLNDSLRRYILDIVFQTDDLSQVPAEQVPDWGKGRSRQRLLKMANSIAAFARNGKRRSDDSLSQAVRHWEEDLDYLRSKYNSEFEIDWPKPGKRGASNDQQAGLFG